MSRCRCSSGCGSCASPAATSMSSSRSASPASSSCRSSAAASSPPTACRSPSSSPRIHERTTHLVADQYRCLNELLLPALAAEGVPLLGRAEWSPQATAVARAVLRARDRAGADPARPRPGAPLPAHPEQEPELHRAPVGQGRLRPRQRARHRAGAALAAARGAAAGRRREPRAACCSRPSCRPSCTKLFTGIQVIGCYQFRVTRNSDLFVDDEEIDDLRRALEGELAHRRYGAAVRLETSNDCPEDMVKFLQAQFASNGLDTYHVRGAGEPQPPLGRVRPGAAAGPQVPDLHARDCRSAWSARTDLFAVHPPEGRAAAPSLPELRAGDGFPAPGGRRPAGARDQADAVPRRRTTPRWSMRWWPRPTPART